MWVCSNRQSQICMEKVLWTLTHSNWKRVFIKTERQAICYLCDNSCLMYGIETRLTKAEHELKLNLTEMSMIRWMWRVKLNKRKKSEELIELSGFGTSQSDDQEEYVEMIWTCWTQRRYSLVVWHRKLKKWDRQDTRGRPGGTVLRTTWKI